MRTVDDFAEIRRLHANKHSIRAIALRYQPTEARVFELLGAGGALRSRDIAHLGDR